MLEIIGAGFARTGTLSLKTSLEQLGYAPCLHMYDVIASPERLQQWIDVAEHRDADHPWDDIFDGFAATVDWPAAASWRELAARYPDAKVILTVRDAESWYESVNRSIYQLYLHGRQQEPGAEAGGLDLGKVAGMTNSVVWEGIFGGRFDDKAHAISRYEQHVADVQREIPAGRLLVFDVTEGWEPLCEFLGKPVPPAPFPHANDSDEFGRRHPVQAH